MSWSLVFCCHSDPLKHSESQQNHCIWDVCSANRWDAMKTAMTAAGFGQQNGPGSPWQHLNSLCTTNTSKVEQIRLQSFASSVIFTWPLANWLPILQASQQLLQGKSFHNQRQAENAFQVFVESQITDFYDIGMNVLISCWQQCVDCTTKQCVGSYSD